MYIIMVQMRKAVTFGSLSQRFAGDQLADSLIDKRCYRLKMMAQEFPTDIVVSKQGNVCVKYLADTASSRYLTGSKAERKLRYVEVAKVKSNGRYFILVYKVKKNNTVPFFKIELVANSVVKTADRYSEFRFFIDNEDTAIFDLEDSDTRNDWVEMLNGVITSMKTRSPTPQKARSQNAVELKRSPSTERNRTPIYARSTSGAPENHVMTTPVPSSQLGGEHPTASRHRGLFTNPSTSVVDTSLGLVAEPVRRTQRHVESSPLVVTGQTHHRDADLDKTIPIPESSTATKLDHTMAESFALSPYATKPLARATSPEVNRVFDRHGPPHFTPSPVQKTKKAINSPGTGIGVGPGTGHPGEASLVIGADITSPPRSTPGVRASSMSSPSAAHPVIAAPSVPPPLPPVPAETESDTEAEPTTPVANPPPVPLELASPESPEPVGNLTVGVLLQENQALSAMNEELNEALERTESLLRATEDDHGYQMAHLRAMLEKAQEEPAQLKAELADLYEEKESSTQAFADMTHEMELQRTEIRSLKEELAASTHIIHGLEDRLVEYETKYSERNVERISQLEGALDASRSLLTEREVEVEELSNQLEAYRRMIREKEMELREEPFIARSAEKAAKREEMQKEIEVLRDQLDRKDQDFIAGIGGAMESQIRAKMVPLNLSAKKLTSDLAASHAAEEAQRLSRVRLESVVSQQEAYIEQLNQQIAMLRAETVKIAELQQEVVMHKDDARAASIQRDQAFKDREDSARRVSTLERELYTQREAFQAQLEAAQAEIFKQRAQVTKVGMEDSHLLTELAILQRRVDLGKEQYLQLETQLHEAQRQLAMEGQHNAKKKDSFTEALEAANQTVRELQSQCKSLEDLLAAEQLDGRRRMQEHEEAVNALKRTNKESTARIGTLEEKSHKLELGLTSERITAAHLKEVNEALESKLQSAAEKHIETVQDLEDSLARTQKSLTEVRQQLKDSEAQRRSLSERDGSTQREMSFTLKAAEDANRALREEIAQLNRERTNEHKAMEDRFAAQVTLQEKLERKTQELERLLSSSESERRIADQHHATREAELITINTELTTEIDGLGVYVHKEKGEVAKLQRALEEVQADLRAKTQFHEKLTKLHNEQVQTSSSLSDEVVQLRKASAEQVTKHNLEIDQLQHKYNSLQASLSQSAQTQQERIQTLEDSLISTSQELKRTAQQLEQAHAKTAQVEEALSAAVASSAQTNAELHTVAAQLESQTRESAAQSQHIAELTHTCNAQRDDVADLTAELRQVQASDAAHAQELEAVKAQLQDTEDQLRDADRNLKAAEDRIHYLQNIAIPDLNNSAVDTVERSKSEQARYAAEIEALHRSIEQREKAAQQLHARIRELEEVEVTLNQNNATLSLKLGEMIPIKEHNHRLEQQRSTTSTEINELSASKLAALSERDEAVSRMTVVMQECRREAYTLRRIASNIAIHSDADVRPKDHNRSGVNLLGSTSVVTSSRPVADIFNAAEETGSELREMVALVNAYSESMLRDFAALRNSATHQHLALQTEIAKTSAGGASGAGGEAAGPAPATFVRSPQSQQSPVASPSRDSAAQSAVSLTEMLQQNESMLAKLVNREKTAVSRLARQLEDAVAQRAQSEVKVVDLQARIESLDAQLISIQSSKQSTDQRCSAEVNALQQRVNTLLADLDRRQDEYSEMIAGLTRSHEDQVSRQAAHLAAVMEQRIAEVSTKAKGRGEELEQRLRSTEDTLTAELEGLKRDYDQQVQQYQRLQRECEQRAADSNSVYARLETLQNELDDKASQLDSCLSQLEKAELKAAKEARQRLELERVVRRFKNPGASASSAQLTPGDRSESAYEYKEPAYEPPSASNAPHNAGNASSANLLRAGSRPSFSASSARLSVGPTPAAPVMNRSFYSRETPEVRDNRLQDNSFDGNVSTTSYSVAEEYVDGTDVRYSASKSPAATPTVRTAAAREPRDFRDPRTALLVSQTQSSSSSIYSTAEKVLDTNRIMSKTSFAFKPGESRDPVEAVRRYAAPSVNSTIRSVYSTPDRSPEHAPAPALASSGTSFRADPNASASSASGNSAFNRAFQATSRIEEAMKAKGWKLNK